MDLRTRIKRFALVLLALSAAGFASGCGGGGGGGASVSSQNLQSFDPNYTRDLKSLTHWASFPVKVYFAPGPESTPERQAQAVNGIEQWAGRTGGLVQFEVTQQSAEAQVTIRFVAALEGTLIGWTNWTYDGAGIIQKAESKIATNRLSDSDIAWVAAHEFGHALGLDGHSVHAEDVMYASHVLGSAWDLTVRDENTVKTNYDWMIAGGSARSRAVIWGPLQTAEVKCYLP